MRAGSAIEPAHDPHSDLSATDQGPDIEGRARPIRLDVDRIEVAGIAGRLGSTGKAKGKVLAFPTIGIQGLLACRPMINGKEMVMVVDSGASECIMTKGFYDTIPEPRPKLLPTRFKFTIANGEVMPAVGVCDVRMALAEELVTSRFFVSDCPDELALLGMTYLRKSSCAFHAKKEKLIYDDKREVKLSRERISGSFLLRSARAIRIPGDGYAIVKADIDSLYFNGALENKPVCCQGSEVLWDDKGVSSIDGYTVIEKGKAKIVLRNSCGSSVKIAKGAIIGEAFPCGKAVILDDKFESEMNPEYMRKYARTLASEGDDVPRVLEAYLSEEQKDLFRSVGEDPPDDLEGQPEEKHGKNEDEMFAPIPIPLEGPEEEEGIPIYMKPMFDKEVTENAYLSDEFKAEAKAVFINMKDAFFDQSKPISQTDYAYHHIYTEDDKPVSFRPNEYL